MSPISYADAYEQTNPNETDEQRDANAKAIVAGVAANDVYWNHADPLDALKAAHDGHGVVTRGSDDADPNAGAIEGTAVDEGALPETTNKDATIAALRKQLADAGQTPEA